MENFKIHFVISPQDYAQDFGRRCIEQWGQTDSLHASYIVSLGGDGTALQAQQEALTAYLGRGEILPVYNIDCSNSRYHRGALTNRKVKDPKEIKQCILDAKKMEIYPLQADCELLEAKYGWPFHSYYGLNEIAVKVSDFQMTHLEVKFNGGKPRSIQGDGCILSTYFGKKGYYYNLGGKDFEEGHLGFQTIGVRQGINRVIPDNSVVSVKVISHHRPTSVMRDCNLVSPPILNAVIRKSNLPLIILKDKEEHSRS